MILMSVTHTTVAHVLVLEDHNNNNRQPPTLRLPLDVEGHNICTHVGACGRMSVISMFVVFLLIRHFVVQQIKARPWRYFEHELRMCSPCRTLMCHSVYRQQYLQLVLALDLA